MERRKELSKRSKEIIGKVIAQKNYLSPGDSQALNSDTTVSLSFIKEVRHQVLEDRTMKPTYPSI